MTSVVPPGHLHLDIDREGRRGAGAEAGEGPAIRIAGLRQHRLRVWPSDWPVSCPKASRALIVISRPGWSLRFDRRRRRSRIAWRCRRCGKCPLGRCRGWQHDRGRRENQCVEGEACLEITMNSHFAASPKVHNSGLTPVCPSRLPFPSALPVCPRSSRLTPVFPSDPGLPV